MLLSKSGGISSAIKRDAEDIYARLKKGSILPCQSTFEFLKLSSLLKKPNHPSPLSLSMSVAA